VGGAPESSVGAYASSDVSGDFPEPPLNQLDNSVLRTSANAREGPPRDPARPNTLSLDEAVCAAHRRQTPTDRPPDHHSHARCRVARRGPR